MDNELNELEAELKSLRPLQASLLLRARLQNELERPSRARRRWAWWTALPLAAGVAGVMFFRSADPVTEGSRAAAAAGASGNVHLAAEAAIATYKPVSADNVLYEERDEGLVTLADGSKARKYRASYVDTITWKDTRSQASLRWSVPRTEERVVPVQFQ